ncbi:hypothetical protein MMC14_004590 [Varicellaria rhodocarpa]|nr:hypothetical protein [Varicellaria rhodocarpa]
MCSWFCETFCCFLLRFRDSCTQNISTPTHSQSRSFEADRLGIRQDGERGRELSTVSRDAARGGHVADIQSRPITPIPQYIFTTSQTSDRTQSIRIIAFDGEEDPTRLGSRLGTLPLRSSSAFSTHSAAPIEDGGGDIGLLSPPRSPYTPSAPPSQHPQPPHHSLSHHLLHNPHTHPFPSFEPQTTSDPSSNHHDTDPAAILTTFEAQPTASDFAAASALDDYRPDAPPEESSGQQHSGGDFNMGLLELEAGVGAAAEVMGNDGPPLGSGDDGRKVVELEAESSTSAWRG